ncbi:MAG: 4'-phosphopantetheinyl transferase [Granulosicoccus sp.]
MSNPLEWAGLPVSITARAVEDCTVDLHPDELSLASRFSAKRSNTFSSGRRCARDLLISLGQPAVPLPRAEDGSIIWPEGFMGSVSHTDHWAVAAVARKESGLAKALGIDLEPRQVLSSRLLSKIATESERLTFQNEQDWQGIALFSLKESLYKCLRPSFGKFIRFHDVELSGFDTLQPTVKFCSQDLINHCDSNDLELRLSITAEHVFSMVWWRAEPV